MANRIVLYPYKMRSRSCGDLQSAIQARGIPCKRVRPDGNYIVRNTDLIVGWGNSHPPHWHFESSTEFLNAPSVVAVASNKLKTFEALKEAGVSIPDFSTNIVDALMWLTEKHSIVVRQLLTSTQGKGIQFVEYSTSVLPEDVPEAPLYVKYVKKSAEYRVHVFDGKVIDVQQKRRRRGFKDVNNRIRNLKNGWVFCRDDVNPPDCVFSLAEEGVKALALDFGAVDIIYNAYYDRAYILEVNTAPGLEGQTLNIYTSQLRGKL